MKYLLLVLIFEGSNVEPIIAQEFRTQAACVQALATVQSNVHKLAQGTVYTADCLEVRKRGPSV